jgi:SAM-dependent methyltransferase
VRAIRDRASRLADEQQWYEHDERQEGRVAVGLRRILQSPLFYHPARAKFAYALIDRRLTDLLQRYGPLLPDGAILNLPSGDGYDYPLLEVLGRPIVAADVSYRALQAALESAPHPCVCCDSMRLPFVEDTFAAVVINKFLHHVVDDGFGPYLRECHRVLKPGGFILIQEPSILYPPSLFTVTARSVLRRLVGYELLGHVPHERAFLPRELVRSLRVAGFANVRTEGSSFVHNRFPVFTGRAIASVQRPLLRVPAVKHCAWWVLYSAWKQPVNGKDRY